MQNFSGEIRRHKNNVFFESIDQIDLSYISDDGRSYLHEAVGYDNYEVACALLERRIDVNLQTNKGHTALHFAVKPKQLRFAQLLLDAGARVDLQDEDGNEPLWVAVFNARGKYDTVELLMNAGANPLHKNNAGVSALDFAKKINDQRMVELLESKN